MSDQPETVAAILAEMRAAAKSTDLFDGEEVGEPLIRGTKVEEWADRIEAAAELKRNAHTNDIHDALYMATGIPGNAALAAPARNCDRFKTLDEAREAFQDLRGHKILADVELWDSMDEAGALVRWLFAEAEGDKE